MKQFAAVRAFAKINLTLDITGTDSRGYHLLKTVMQSVSLWDELCIAKTESDQITFSCSDPALPRDDKNLAVKAAKAYLSATGLPEKRIHIELKKNIPKQAGLAGGSADAAGVLLGMNALAKKPMPSKALMEIAASLGADVPFCLTGGTALAEGIGEVLTPLPSLPESAVILIAKPHEGCSTPEIFSAYDRMENPVHPDCGGLISAVISGNTKQAAALCANILEQAVSLSEISTIKEQMLQSGALGSAMSGSGSAVFGIFETEQKALLCMELLKKKHPFAAVCKPVSKGAEIIPENL